MNFDQLFDFMSELDASDMHLQADALPCYRVDGELVFYGAERVPEVVFEEFVSRFFSEKTKEMLETERDVDFAFEHKGERLRANVFRQKGKMAIAIRRFRMKDLSFEGLGLPPVLKKLCSQRRGLILVTGAAGSGKTTTLAAMVDYINRNFPKRIITIEDPVEIQHENKRSLIAQREVGYDTESFYRALKYVLRQDPDVILIGEIRDFETMTSALMAAETGHLVLSSLHTTDAPETVNRLIDMSPSTDKREIRSSLAMNLSAVISQRLLKSTRGGMVPAVEVLVSTERVREAIMDPVKTGELRRIIEEGQFYGMQSFDQAMLKLLQAGLISPAVAIESASVKQDFKLAAERLGIRLDES